MSLTKIEIFDRLINVKKTVVDFKEFVNITQDYFEMQLYGVRTDLKKEESAEIPNENSLLSLRLEEKNLSGIVGLLEEKIAAIDNSVQDVTEIGLALEDEWKQLLEVQKQLEEFEKISVFDILNKEGGK